MAQIYLPLLDIYTKESKPAWHRHLHAHAYSGAIHQNGLQLGRIFCWDWFVCVTIWYTQPSTEAVLPPSYQAHWILVNHQ